MAVKHVQDYFNQICNDYHELLDTLHDMEEEYNRKLVSPETLENLKKQIQPIKNNYETISYIMYLLNMPAKKGKKKRYEGQNKKLLSHSKSLQEVRKENKNILTSIKSN